MVLIPPMGNKADYCACPEDTMRGKRIASIGLVVSVGPVIYSRSCCCVIYVRVSSLKQLFLCRNEIFGYVCSGVTMLFYFILLISREIPATTEVVGVYCGLCLCLVLDISKFIFCDTYLRGA